MAQVKSRNDKTGRFYYPDEASAKNYINTQGRLVVGSPVGVLNVFRRRAVAGVVATIATFRTRDAAQIVWTDRTTSFVITDADLTAGVYGPQVNGRYRINLGNLRSTVPGVPALKYLGAAALTFYGMNLFGWGMDATAQTGMSYFGTNSDVRFEDTLFLSGKPPAGYDGAMPGHDIVSEGGANLEAVNCESHGTRGTLVYQFKSGYKAGGGVRFQRFPKMNIDGRRVDVNGNWDGRTKVANYIQLQKCAALDSNTFIEDYISRNDPVYAAEVEDVVSVFGSYCASGQTVEFRRFLVENVFPTDPLFAASGGTRDTLGLRADGSLIGTGATGGLMGDFQDLTGYTVATIAQGFVMKAGTVLSWANYGAGIQAGHNNIIDGVTVISAGVIRSKAAAGWSRLAWTDGGGIEAWDRAPNSNSSFYFSNQIKNCIAGHYVQNADGSRRSGYTPIWDASNGGGGCTFTNNTQRPIPATIAAALAEQDAARTAQLAVWSAAGTVLGLVGASPFVNLKISTDPAA